MLAAIVPVMITAIIVYGICAGINVYQVFTEGVRNGFESVVAIFPALLALFVAVGVFRSSGLADFLTSLLAPLASVLHFPAELLPFALLRPVSGSGSLALASDLFATYGPDSFVGNAASIMMGSTETTFYTVAVYFGACGTKNTRHTLKCALSADVFSMAMSVLAANFIKLL